MISHRLVHMTTRLATMMTLAVPALFAAASPSSAQTPRAEPGVRTSRVGIGWARSSVNTVVFRTGSVVSHGDVQYTAYYDDSAHVVLAKRRLRDTTWTTVRTTYTNDVTDAHNAISLAVDGSGVLHVAWAEHNRALHYARARALVIRTPRGLS